MSQTQQVKISIIPDSDAAKRDSRKEQGPSTDEKGSQMKVQLHLAECQSNPQQPNSATGLMRQSSLSGQPVMRA